MVMRMTTSILGREQYLVIDERPTRTAYFDNRLDRLVRRPISELLSENAQPHPMARRYVQSHVRFQFAASVKRPETGVSAHKMIVI
jgi:hypothetical protein